MARPKADPAALAALLEVLPAPAQGGWLAAAQAAGAARLAAMGLPQRRARATTHCGDDGPQPSTVIASVAKAGRCRRGAVLGGEDDVITL